MSRRARSNSSLNGLVGEVMKVEYELRCLKQKRSASSENQRGRYLSAERKPSPSYARDTYASSSHQRTTENRNAFTTGKKSDVLNKSAQSRVKIQLQDRSSFRTWDIDHLTLGDIEELEKLISRRKSKLLANKIEVHDPSTRKIRERNTPYKLFGDSYEATVKNISSNKGVHAYSTVTTAPTTRIGTPMLESHNLSSEDLCYSYSGKKDSSQKKSHFVEEPPSVRNLPQVTPFELSERSESLHEILMKDLTQRSYFGSARKMEEFQVNYSSFNPKTDLPFEYDISLIDTLEQMDEI